MTNKTRHLSKIKGNYYIRITLKGKGHSLPTGTSELRVAIERRNYVLDYLPLLKNGQLRLSELSLPWKDHGITGIKKLTVHEAADKFIQARRIDRIRESTLVSYRHGLNSFLEAIGENCLLSDVTIVEINQFKLYWTKTRIRPKESWEGLSPTTINIRLRSLKVFFNWCHDNELVAEIPKIKQIPNTNKEPIYLSNEQFDLICDHVNPYLQKVFQFYRSTGCRLSEPFYATLDRNWMNLPAEHTKTHTSRDIYLSDPMVETLKEMQRRTHLHEDTVRRPDDFKPVRRKTYSILYYSKAFHNACIKAKIKNRKFHSLRHSFAVREYLKTRDIYAVAKMLGHANVSTTQIYAKFNLRKLQQDFPDLVEKGDGALPSPKAKTIDQAYKNTSFVN